MLPSSIPLCEGQQMATITFRDLMFEDIEFSTGEDEDGEKKLYARVPVTQGSPLGQSAVFLLAQTGTLQVVDGEREMRVDGAIVSATVWQDDGHLLIEWII